MKSILAAALLALSLNSFADQCAYITPESAEKAVKLISLSKKKVGGVLDLCENCGEKVPTEIKVNQIDSVKVSDLYSEIAINGQGIDLAYTYVYLNDGVWGNLARLANCEASGISTYIIEKKLKNGKIKYIPVSRI